MRTHMIRIFFLVLCFGLLLTSCQQKSATTSQPTRAIGPLFSSITPPPAHEPERDQALREFLFRTVMEGRVYVTCWYVDYSSPPIADYTTRPSATEPPLALLATLRQQGFPCLPASQARTFLPSAPHDPRVEVTDDNRSDRAWVAFAYITRWLTQDRAEVMCGDYKGLEAGSYQTLVVEWKDGKWRVVSGKIAMS